MKRLETLGFAFSPQAKFSGEQFALGFAIAPVPTMTIEIRPEWDPTLVRLERGDAGYDRVWMTLGPKADSNWSQTIASEANTILRALPPSVRELRIETRDGLSAETREWVRGSPRRSRI